MATPPPPVALSVRYKTSSLISSSVILLCKHVSEIVIMFVKIDPGSKKSHFRCKAPYVKVMNESIAPLTKKIKKVLGIVRRVEGRERE